MIDTNVVIRELVDAGLQHEQAEAIMATILRCCAARFEQMPTKEDMRGEFRAVSRVLASDIAADRSRILQWLFAGHALLLATIVGLARFTSLC